MNIKGKAKVSFLFAALIFTIAACGSADETTPAEEPDKTYVCALGMPCDDPDISCHIDWDNPDSGKLTCTGTEFVTTCEEGYYCNFDGSTPGLWPRCLAWDGQILACDPDDLALYPE